MTDKTKLWQAIQFFAVMPLALANLDTATGVYTCGKVQFRVSESVATLESTEGRIVTAKLSPGAEGLVMTTFTPPRTTTAKFKDVAATFKRLAVEKCGVK